MLATEDRTIGEHTYQVTQLGALTGRKVLFRLGKLLGPLLAGVSDPGSLSRALSGLEEADFEWLCNTFAAGTKLVQVAKFNDGEKQVLIALAGQFDNHFAGHYGHLIAWLSFCVEVNFRNFLAELPAESLAGLRMPKL